jgi:hypothetical protein
LLTYRTVGVKFVSKIVLEDEHVVNEFKLYCKMGDIVNVDDYPVAYNRVVRYTGNELFTELSSAERDADVQRSSLFASAPEKPASPSSDSD